MEVLADLAHTHCDACIKFKCNVKPKVNFACPMVTCQQDCGARFHACKLDDHRMLCSNERVPCINSVYGCPLIIVRFQMSRHLHVCPASVVHCTMEWNRWPVCSSERQSHVPFRQPNPLIVPEQLDIALALRDQRMLNESMKASVHLRRAMKTNLTNTHPAVPLLKQSNSYDDEGTKSLEWNKERSVTPPGLQSSICNELYKATQRTTETLSATLDMVTSSGSSTTGANGNLDIATESHDDYDDFLVPGNNTFGHEICKESFFLRTEAPPPGLILSSFGLRHVTTKDKPTVNHSYLAVNPAELNVECAHCRKWRKKWKEEDELKQEAAGKASKAKEGGGDANHCHSSKNGYDGKKSHTIDSTHGQLPGNGHHENCDELNCIFATESIVSDVSAAPARDHSSTMVTTPLTSSFTRPPTPPLLPAPVFSETLGLDITLEMVTRYQNKHKSMYTFLCAQDFRRDEFSSHFQNVHSEIHGGLNGWLEQRCPLAIYGCTYSRRRLHPGCTGNRITHDKSLASFGLRPSLPAQTGYAENNRAMPSESNSPMKESDEHANFTVCSIGNLPFEILQHIARFLDSFSLSNLSMTSLLMREVCCTLLEERGIVVHHWRRKKYGDMYSWQIAYQVWQFSTAFTPVTSWGFEDNPSIAEHLKTCTFNKKLVRTKKFRVMPDFQETVDSE